MSAADRMYAYRRIVSQQPKKEGMIAFKAGARVKRMTPALTVILNAAAQAQEELGYPKVLVVTSVNDGRHSTNSRHYKDEAIDFRTKGAASNTMGTTERKRAFRSRLQSFAGARFRVLFEAVGTPNEHLHAQVRKGQVYP
jgi:hypothetical protein